MAKKTKKDLLNEIFHDAVTDEPIKFYTGPGKIEHVERNIGETWVDDDGKEWEQKIGYKVRINTATDYVQGALNELNKKVPRHCYQVQLGNKCKFDGIYAIPKKRIDENAIKIHGMCEDCAVEMITDMRKKGTFDEYMIGLNTRRMQSWLDEESQTLQDSLQQLLTNPNIEYPLSDGRVRTFTVNHNTLIDAMELYINDLNTFAIENKLNFNEKEYTDVLNQIRTKYPKESMISKSNSSISDNTGDSVDSEDSTRK